MLKKKDEEEGRKLCICVGGKLGLFLAAKKLIVAKITSFSFTNTSQLCGITLSSPSLFLLSTLVCLRFGCIAYL